MKFLQFCVSEREKEYPITMRNGAISSIMVDENGHIRGSVSTDSGCSGEPIFSNPIGYLLGICVGMEQDQQTDTNYVCRILPCNILDSLDFD